MGEERPSAARAQHGVYYARSDYAGFWRRLAVDAVDFTALLVLSVLLAVALVIVLPGGAPAVPQVAFWSSVALGFVYLVLLKRPPLRTLGYLIFGVRIVDLRGAPPTLWTLSLRGLFALLGPLNMLVDILWLTGDAHRQALRDKFAHTYVVRDGAVPEGRGAIVYSTYSILGANFLFAEVRPDRSPAG